MLSEPLDIAVIGMGCRFPEADSPEAFFGNLMANRDSVGEIPPDRWSHRKLYGPEGTLASKWGGFLAGIETFDARFFRILPSEAEYLDPQQKLFLMCSWEAMEDAGYARRERTAGKPVGVYAGVTWSEFSLLANEYGYLQDRYRGPGCLAWGIANRTSYFFDWTGPSLAIDSACSSSLAAVHLAAQSLRSGECSMALAGGVNLNLHPAKYLFLSESNFLSGEGKCRGFGEGGSGYVPSEGAGVVVLKRLEDAVADGDRIYGVLKATSANHGGKATGYTVPNPRAQADLVRSAIRRSGLDARAISYLECHGTGTDLGDPIEIAGLRMAFSDFTGDKGFCGIGTVKSNIGHCEAAAGVAGLIKVLLAMREGRLPGTLHAQTPNRKIDFGNSPFYLVRENRAWVPETGPLAAGVSSFGAGGSNGHCIVQAYTAPLRASGGDTAAFRWIPLSTRSPERTQELCAALERTLSARQEGDLPILADLERTLRAREEFEHRVAIEADTAAAFLKGLRRYLANPENPLVAADPGDAKVRDIPGLDRRVRSEDARLWVAGALSHSRWPAPEGRLLSLPHYPFEKARSWIHDAPVLYRKPVFAAPLHPLVDRNESTARQGLFAKVLHRDEFFVSEHYVAGHPVLPGVCHLEMISYAASRYLEAPSVRISDVWFLEPVSLGEGEETGLRAEIAAHGQDHRFQIVSAGGDTKHSTGRIAAEASRQRPDRIDVAAIWDRCGSSMGPAECYRLFGEKGIAQSGRFRVLTELRRSGGEAIARLSLSRAFAGPDEFGFNPTLLDGAVQTAMIHMHTSARGTGMVLPYQIGAYLRHGPTPQAAYAIATLQSAQAKRYHIAITDDAGEVLAEFRDFVLKEYKPRPEKARLMVFAAGMRPLPEARLSDELPEPVPVAWLGGRNDDAPGLGLPDHWKRFAWFPGSPLPIDAIEAWLEGAEGGVPRLCLPLDPLPAEGAEAYQALASTAKRLAEALRSLAKLGRPLECIAYLEREESAPQPLSWACASLFRTLNLELPHLRARMVESVAGPGAEPGTAMRALLREIGAENAETHVLLRQGTRYAPKPGPLAEANGGEARVAEPEAWLVTGAGGALGFQVALDLLRKGRRVALLGRSPLSAEKRDALAAIGNLEWEYRQCDLARPADTAAAVGEAIAKSGGHWGVAHCAGVLSDGAFLKQDWPAFERVLSAKAASLLHVLSAVPAGRLRTICLFSSITAQFGNRGQSGYAFANGFLDGYAAAAAAAAPGTRCVSIDWPYWEQGGMRIGEDRLSAYAESFLTEPLPMAEGLRALESALSGQDAVVGVLYSGAVIADLSAKSELKALPRVEEPSASARSAGPGPGPDPVAGDPEAKKRDIRAFILGFLESELKLNLREGDFQTRLSEMGVDSIAQMDLIAKLESLNRFAGVPQSLLEEHNSVAELVEFFFRNHQDADYGQA